MTILDPTQRLDCGPEGDNAIVVSHLTKEFRIRYRTSVKNRLLNALKQPRGVHPFLALNDISFRVPRGQTVAVIGRNGSGKSTLLGLLARVYRPTSGEIGLYNAQGGAARIAPLLDLGSGFHLDLTGAENIEFYGAVLGLTAQEMAARYDQIVEFAELGAKVNTTIRNWNEGARLRLGFSIAVHIDPDIMLFDEVLAVGDEAFQNKCFRLIHQMHAQGKTILFVSHELPKVERVAERILWLRDGSIYRDGDMQSVLAEYREFSRNQNAE